MTLPDELDVSKRSIRVQRRSKHTSVMAVRSAVSVGINQFQCGPVFVYQKLCTVFFTPVAR